MAAKKMPTQRMMAQRQMMMKQAQMAKQHAQHHPEIRKAKKK